MNYDDEPSGFGAIGLAAVLTFLITLHSCVPDGIEPREVEPTSSPSPSFSPAD